MTASMVAEITNPKLGTRQYPKMVIPHIPLKGYNGSMTVGETIKRQRLARGMSQEDLSQLVGATQSTIDRIEKDQFKRMPSALPKIARVLNLRLRDLDASFEEVSRDRPAAPMLSDRDFPIHGAVEGGPGQIIVSTDPVDWAPRPAPVASVRGAYGLLVVGESMVPEYRPGDTAIVDPNLPVIGGEVYVFYAEKAGEARATIKHLRRAAADLWYVSQWNPPDSMKPDFTLSRREWNVCHRVLGKYSRK